ncbi:MAG: hypothetical protein M3O61_06670 [Gemmatimonadota bacterium]|nr:hypothetical protein [Gemmatimonadota bacterium]
MTRKKTLQPSEQSSEPSNPKPHPSDSNSESTDSISSDELKRMFPDDEMAVIPVSHMLIKALDAVSPGFAKKMEEESAALRKTKN